MVVKVLGKLCPDYCATWGIEQANGAASMGMTSRHRWCEILSILLRNRIA